MGGGTSLVEARASGRLSAGSDVSALATFIAHTKTRVLSASELANVYQWLHELPGRVNLRDSYTAEGIWLEQGYHKHMDGISTWAVRKFVGIALQRLHELPGTKQSNLARCVILRTAQWALDGRRTVPSVSAMRQQFVVYADRMISGAAEYASAARKGDKLSKPVRTRRTECINTPASQLASHLTRRGCVAPKLILTSPPYPGVHILYHRWQLCGGKESPAPFWIANKLDGAGESHYLMYARSPDTTRYFHRLVSAFRPIVAYASRNAVFVQLVAFSKPDLQLPQYLSAMEQSGLREYFLSEHIESHDGRLWRSVPNRRWHASRKGGLSSAREVVLLHKKA